MENPCAAPTGSTKDLWESPAWSFSLPACSANGRLLISTDSVNGMTGPKEDLCWRRLGQRKIARSAYPAEEKYRKSGMTWPVLIFFLNRATGYFQNQTKKISRLCTFRWGRER